MAAKRADRKEAKTYPRVGECPTCGKEFMKSSIGDSYCNPCGREYQTAVRAKAKRAIELCEAMGFDLDSEQYDTWLQAEWDKALAAKAEVEYELYVDRDGLVHRARVADVEASKAAKAARYTAWLAEPMDESDTLAAMRAGVDGES